MPHLTDQMIACWDNPLSTEHDPRHLLLLGAKEIRRLERMVEAKEDMIRVLHDTNTEIRQMLLEREPDPNAPLYITGLAMVAFVTFVVWMMA